MLLAPPEQDSHGRGPILLEQGIGISRLGGKKTMGDQVGDVHFPRRSDSRDPRLCRGHLDPTTVARRSPVSLRFPALSSVLPQELSGKPDASAIRLTS